MKDILDKITSKNKYSYKNSLRVNVLKCFSCFMLMLFFPSFVVLALSSLTNNSLLMSTISSILISIIIFFMYYKDLIAEFHTFKSNFKENVKISFNDYFLGLALMIFFNIIIAFVLSDLIYILPYGSFGACFALMDYRGKNTYNSIMMHAIHNTATGILLLIVYFSGVIS